MSAPKPETVAAALSLAEHSDMISEFFLREMRAKGMGAVVDAVHAYRATLPKLRTRAEVDRDIVIACRAAVESGQLGNAFFNDYVGKLCREPTSGPGPSSVDAADGDGPLPPSAPVSPAGAAYSFALHDTLARALERIQATCEEVSELHRVLYHLGHVKAVPLAPLPIPMPDYPSGPPGAAAAKESSDTTAAAPAGAALEDVEACGREEAEALRDRIKELERTLATVRRLVNDLEMATS